VTNTLAYNNCCVKYYCGKVIQLEAVGISLLIRLCSKGEDPNIDPNYKIGIEVNSSDKHTSLQYCSIKYQYKKVYSYDGVWSLIGLYSNGGILTLTRIIRLRWKHSVVTNTLAYNNTV